MYKCIYTAYEGTDEEFKEKEHVFPKSIGGLHTLPRGYVSDKINAAFSKFELKFLRNDPFFVIDKMMKPPKGRKHLNKFNISLLGSEDQPVLGYMRDNEPVVIPQISVDASLIKRILISDTVGLIRAPIILPQGSDEFIEGNESVHFACLLAACDNHYNFVDIPADFFYDHYILGINDHKIYITKNEGLSEQDAITIANRLIGGFIRSISQPDTMRRMSGRVETRNLSRAIIQLKEDVNARTLVMAKVAFNCLAMVYGQDFVLNQAFQRFRDIILNFVINKNSSQDELGNLLVHNSLIDLELCQLLCRDLNISPDSHLTIFRRNGRVMKAQVLLRGGLVMDTILLTDSLDGNFDINPDGVDKIYLCDSERNLEGDLQKLVRDGEIIPNVKNICFLNLKI